jgi:hypothetical protein
MNNGTNHQTFDANQFLNNHENGCGCIVIALVLFGLFGGIIALALV